MDLSKLPKLSRTEQPTTAGVRYERPREPGEGMFAAMDVFLAVGMGILFIFLGLGYAKHQFGSGQVYAEVMPFTWQPPNPKAGQVIPYQELTPENQKKYDTQVAQRKAQIVGDASLFYFGVGLIAAGVLGLVGHLSAFPTGLRKLAGYLAVAVTAAGLVFCLYACFAMLGAGITPLMTMVAVLLGGLTLFMQAGAMRELSLATDGASHDRPIATLPGRAMGAGLPAGASSRSHAPAGRSAADKFVHQHLRKAVTENPAGALGTLQGPGARPFLAQLWSAACRDASLPDASLPAGVEAEMTQVGPYSAAIVTLPTPYQVGEAHFAGVVLRSYVRQDGAVIERTPLVLYYTLEKASAAADAAPVLCEWQGADHVRFTDAVTPDFNAFREAMRQKVNARQAREDDM